MSTWSTTISDGGDNQSPFSGNEIAVTQKQRNDKEK